jgi:pyrimidine-nucleoside phosphorylase
MTDMDVPLGRAVGNWPEVEESIRCLQGADVPDLMTVTLALAGEMLHLGGVAGSPEDGRDRARRAIASGQAFETFVTMVEAQGGDPAVLRDPSSRATPPATNVHAPTHAQGFVSDLDALALGRTAMALGAGRRTKADKVDPTAGIVLCKKPGDPVIPGEVLARLYTQKTDEIDRFSESVTAAYTFSDTQPASTRMLIDRYTKDGWSNVKTSSI